MPVEVLRFEIERECIGKHGIQRGGDVARCIRAEVSLAD